MLAITVFQKCNLVEFCRKIYRHGDVSVTISLEPLGYLF